MKTLSVSASQHGLTFPQRGAARLKLTELKFDIIRHGCCIGGDEQLARISKQIGYHVIGHPPIDTKKMMEDASVINDIILEPKGYIDRNHDMVDWSELLLAFPSTHHEVLRSGTWATIRYARKVRRPHAIIYPDGSIDDKMLLMF